MRAQTESYAANRVALEVVPRGALTVAVDRTRILQVLTNLLDNPCREVRRPCRREPSTQSVRPIAPRAFVAARQANTAPTPTATLARVAVTEGDRPPRSAPATSGPRNWPIRR